MTSVLVLAVGALEQAKREQRVRARFIAVCTGRLKFLAARDSLLISFQCIGEPNMKKCSDCGMEVGYLNIFEHCCLWKGVSPKLKEDIQKVLETYEWERWGKFDSKRKGNYVRRMIRDHGPIEALSRTVAKRRKRKIEKRDLQVGFLTLMNSGKLHLTFEAIVDEHGPSLFTKEIVEDAQEKLNFAKSIPSLS